MKVNTTAKEEKIIKHLVKYVHRNMWTNCLNFAETCGLITAKNYSAIIIELFQRKLWEPGNTGGGRDKTRETREPRKPNLSALIH